MRAIAAVTFGIILLAMLWWGCFYFLPDAWVPGDANGALRRLITPLVAIQLLTVVAVLLLRDPMPLPPPRRVWRWLEISCLFIFISLDLCYFLREGNLQFPTALIIIQGLLLGLLLELLVPALDRVGWSAFTAMLARALFDGILIPAGFYCAYLVRYGGQIPTINLLPFSYPPNIIVIVSVHLAAIARAGLFNSGRFTNSLAIMFHIVKALCQSMLLVAAYLWLARHQAAKFPSSVLLLSIPINLFLLSGWRIINWLEGPQEDNPQK